MEGISLFCVALIPLFWTSGDVCPGFQSQGGYPYLLASLPVYNGFLRFASGVTSTDLLANYMAAELYLIHILVQALLGLKLWIEHATAPQHVTRQMLYRIFYFRF